MPFVSPELDEAVGQKLREWGVLDTKDLKCRFCDQPIEVESLQCPHCGNDLSMLRRWRHPRATSVAPTADGEVPWIKPRSVGCFAVVPFLLLIGWLLR